MKHLTEYNKYITESFKKYESIIEEIFISLEDEDIEYSVWNMDGDGLITDEGNNGREFIRIYIPLKQFNRIKLNSNTVKGFYMSGNKIDNLFKEIYFIKQKITKIIKSDVYYNFSNEAFNILIMGDKIDIDNDYMKLKTAYNKLKSVSMSMTSDFAYDLVYNYDKENNSIIIEISSFSYTDRKLNSLIRRSDLNDILKIHKKEIIENEDGFKYFIITLKLK